jgi:WD40 repeat protein
MRTYPGKNKLALQYLSLSGDGRFVATANRSHYQAHLWDRVSGKLLYTPEDFPVWGAAVNPSGSHLFVWGDDGAMMVDTATFQETTLEPGRYTTVLGFPAGTTDVVGVVSNDRNKDAFVCYAVSGNSVREKWLVEAGRADFINRPFGVSPDGKHFAAQSIPTPVERRGKWVEQPSRVHVRAVATGKLVQQGELPPKHVLNGVTNDGLVIVTLGGTVMKWDLKAAAAVQEVKPKGGGGGAVLSPDGRGMLVLRAKSLLQLDAATFEVVRELTFPLVGDLHSLAYAPDGLTAAVGTGKGQFAIWDVE